MGCAYARGLASFYKLRVIDAKALASFARNQVLCKIACMIHRHK
jgi:hypothetical protein